MTSEHIIRMALEADPCGEDGRFYGIAQLTPETLERFAALVAAAERQAIGEDIMDFYRSLVEKGDPARVKVEHCLSLIRLRAKS